MLKNLHFKARVYREVRELGWPWVPAVWEAVQWKLPQRVDTWGQLAMGNTWAEQKKRPR